MVRLIAFICFLFRGVNEEEVTLKTNKQVYSLLLRATANKSMTLLERIEVILNLLEQLSQNSEASNGGIQWLKCCRRAETVPCECVGSVVLFPMWYLDLSEVISILPMWLTQYTWESRNSLWACDNSGMVWLLAFLCLKCKGVGFWIQTERISFYLGEKHNFSLNVCIAAKPITFLLRNITSRVALFDI